MTHQITTRWYLDLLPMFVTIVIRNVLREERPYNVICVASEYMLVLKALNRINTVDSASWLSLYRFMNISYYCKLNDCTNRVKVILGEWIHSKSKSTRSSHNLKQEQEVLSASIQSITTKIQELSNSSTWSWQGVCLFTRLDYWTDINFWFLHMLWLAKFVLDGRAI